MTRLTLKQHLLIIISCILWTLIAVSVFVVWPATKKILTLRNDITQIESELEIRYLNSQRLKRTERELDQIRTQLDNYKQIAIDKGSELQMITELENLAAKSNVEQVLNVTLFTTKNTNENTGALTKPALSEYYQFSFLVNGAFADEIKYLQTLESMPYYLTIKNIYFEKRQNKKDDTNPIITLTFNGYVYTKPSQQK